MMNHCEPIHVKVWLDCLRKVAAYQRGEGGSVDPAFRPTGQLVYRGDVWAFWSSHLPCTLVDDGMALGMHGLGGIHYILICKMRAYRNSSPSASHSYAQHPPP